MADTSNVQRDDLRGLILQLKSLDVDQIEEDAGAKNDALALAKKVTASLEDPVNKATDLVFRVRIRQSQVLNHAKRR